MLINNFESIINSTQKFFYIGHFMSPPEMKSLRVPRGTPKRSFQFLDGT